MTAAARVLAIQQPTVSSHIQRLEVDFGVELFHRRGRRLELTSFGRTLLNYTRRTFSGEEDAHALLAAAKNQYVGRLVIHAIGPHNVLPVLKLFSEPSLKRFLTTRETWAWCSITSLTQIYLARLTVPSDW
ncbi:LysR family transcriptional regulator [Acidovorax sp. 24-64-9]|uniref:LysR family transcriptional regulator n=1 Tax=Acidovorax sp. 24-64-9 TaxID=1970309 RepID=UPI0025B84864|nr:LysR family transcriptional regulator [Acidovorax sp. 24-64-9]